MRRPVASLVLLGLATATGTSANCPSPDRIRQEATVLINTLRAQGHHCADRYFKPAQPLHWHRLLANVARQHAEDMDRRGFFGHINLDGLTPGGRLDRAGYNWASSGENLGEGQVTVYQVLTEWLESPAHCEALMQAEFRDFGLACTGSDPSLWVLELAGPR